MKLLIIDTSSKTASMALSDGGRVICDAFVNNGYTHSETVLPMIDGMMKTAGWKPEELEGIGVVSGPGSFTGLRIGVAMAKGMAQALGVSAASLDALDILASQTEPFRGYILPILDARRQQVYGALFERADDGELTELIPTTAMALTELLDRIPCDGKAVCAAGDGTDANIELLRNALGARLVLMPEYNRYQRASAAARMAEDMFCAGGAMDPQALMPEYHRESSAKTIEERKANG